jgi:hypothetical protein
MALAALMADAVLLLHAAFALFAIGGGWLALRWRRLIYLHIPALLWGVTVELTGWICPLTPLENRLRAAAGEPVYGGDFLQHYLTTALYPAALTRAVQIALAALLLLANAGAYGALWRAYGPRNQRTASPSASSAERQR